MAISTVVINDEIGLYIEVPDLPVRWMRLQLDAMLRRNGRVTAIEQGDMADTAANIVENAMRGNGPERFRALGFGGYKLNKGLTDE